MNERTINAAPKSGPSICGRIFLPAPVSIYVMARGPGPFLGPALFRIRQFALFPARLSRSPSVQVCQFLDVAISFLHDRNFQLR